MNEPAGLVTFVAKQGAEAELAGLLTEMAGLAARDDGTEIYAVHQSRQDPRTVFVYELCRDKDALKLRQANEELNSLGSRLRDLTESVDVTIGNLVGGDRAARG